MNEQILKSIALMLVQFLKAHPELIEQLITNILNQLEEQLSKP